MPLPLAWPGLEVIRSLREHGCWPVPPWHDPSAELRAGVPRLRSYHPV